jgi:hypothetical protein
MKKFHLTLILSAICFSAYAQVDTISTNVFQSGGKLGIGTDMSSSLVSLEAEVTSGIERNLMMINNLSDGTHGYTGTILKTGSGEFQSVVQDYGTGYVASPYYDLAGFLNLSNNSMA